MSTFTKEDLVRQLKGIRAQGWIKNRRPGNQGGVGNTLEDLLGIKENNLPIPNAAEWELKCQRSSAGSLTTLFHIEPSPRSSRLVPKLLLPQYGWRHKLAGRKYPSSEKSFRQTINAIARTDRGFGIVVRRNEQSIAVSFEHTYVDARHSSWLKEVERRVGLRELNPQPFWGFDDLFHEAGTKLLNCFYIRAETKKENKKEFFKYTSIRMLRRLSQDKFIHAIEAGLILVDFDARTGHNHGTKFRMREDKLPELYAEVIEI